jgi:hypothetical protein
MRPRDQRGDPMTTHLTPADGHGNAASPDRQASADPAARPRAAGNRRAGVPRGWWLLAFLLHLLPFASRPALIGGDEPHYALIAVSLVEDRDLELADDYAAVEAGSRAAGRKRAGQALERHLRETAGRTIPTHPAGVPALVAPLLALQRAVAPTAGPDLVVGLFGLASTFAGLLAGARLLGRRLGDERLGATAAFAAYFGSPLWYSSRTFFTEPYTWSFAVLSLAAAAGRRWTLAAVLLGVTALTKETAALVVAAVLVGTLLGAGPRKAAILAAGPLAAGALWAAANLARGLPPWTTSQPFQVGSPLAGLRGLLVDPSRGLLWFAPVLLAAAACWLLPDVRRRAREQGQDQLPWVALALLVAYLALTCAWIDWRGGSGYGTRLLLPALPGLALPLALALRHGTPGLRRALAMFAVAGFTVGWCAALDPVTAFWDAAAPALLAARPLATLAGLALAAWLAVRLLRVARRDRAVLDG